MAGLADTLAGLAKLRGTTAAAAMHSGDGRLTEITGFGSNPGALRALCYVPDKLVRPAPLVVVLHGCTQTAAAYDAGAGWSQLADRYGFALLFPEQQRQNNANLCFNWFVPGDNQRGGGEALSVSQMVAAMVARYGLDPARVFVTGLSAGGAMTAVMLATYPDVFAGGAIIAGLPYGCAESVPQALELMRGKRIPSDDQLASLVTIASPHPGRWPILSVWQGSADATVNPTNAAAIIAQWRSLHGVDTRPSRIEAVDGYPRRVWCDLAGRDVIEEYSVTGMGHGTPLGTTGAHACGAVGPFMLEACISSSYYICRFWGLVPADATDVVMKKDVEIGVARLPLQESGVDQEGRLTSNFEYDRSEPVGVDVAGKVGKVIEDALRSAGLMP